MGIPQNEIEQINQSVSALVQEANKYQVTTEDDAAVASRFLAKVQTNIKAIESKRVELTKPLNDSLRNINGLFKEMSQPLDEAKRIVSSAILSWRRIENERIAKEEARRQAISDAAAEKRGEENTKEITLDRAESRIGYSQARKVWKYDVVNFTKIPREYLVVSSVTVNDAIRNGAREIPGLKIYQEESLAIRSN